MTEPNANEKNEAVQIIVDRVSSWQDGATEGTVAEELRKGADEVGISLSADEIAKLADAIESRHGAVDAASVLS
ncbi:hypothetical protein GGQ22_05100 [Nocardioides sp. zg-579]|uniref:Uncharacterized protein n=1 Tax=Nocardioides marmotae TaxID=2663857 RepID=A0A6I3J5E6_9ACTN|nr:hypothetical protein [Nocardioides marmotae]MCR6030817.1 hypothetical protein [Gordonia jinghuaiqii]MTB94452.1 hypothetical protein [Nocardioides marmotae]QKE01527.1 hypothetical protein HPC71_10895 [Nocardioides marmotae]